MANASNSHHANSRPGPKPQFPYVMQLRVRNDQRTALARIASTLNVGVSDLIRWFVDSGIDAVENVPTFKTLERMNHAADDH